MDEVISSLSKTSFVLNQVSGAAPKHRLKGGLESIVLLFMFLSRCANVSIGLWRNSNHLKRLALARQQLSVAVEQFSPALRVRFFCESFVCFR